MKVLKGLLSFIFGFLIFILLFALSLTFVVRNTIQNEILVTAVETKGIEIFEDLLEDIDITLEQKDSIVSMLKKDNAYVKYMKLYVDNYIKYVGNNDYKVSEKDAKEVNSFVATTFKDIANTLELEYDNTLEGTELVDKIFKVSFDYINDAVGDDTVEVVKIYSFVTSPIILLSAVGCILVLLLLVGLLKGLSGALKSVGISSLSTGIILLIAYILFLVFKKDILSEIPFDINLINLAIMSITTFVLGIVFIIIGKKIKKREENE